VTLQYVCICWILFRAANFESAITLITQYLWLGQGGAAKLPSWLVYIAPGLLLRQWLSSRYRFLDQFEKLRPGAFSFAYGSLWALSIAMLPLGFRPFIYFQF
jgi:alginate O-acetyltransferase complex protein AlgI